MENNKNGENITYNLEIDENTLYLCGGITDVPNFLKVFKEKKLILEKAGYIVVSPVELPHKNTDDWRACMRLDIMVILQKCGGIALIDGHNKSKGATIEVWLARSLDITVKPIREWVWLKTNDRTKKEEE